MNNQSYLHFFKNENYEFKINESEFITFIGSGNNCLLDAFITRKNSYITLNDENISEMKTYKYRKSISYILNKDLDVFISETVEDEVAFGMESLAIPKNEMKEIITNKLREFRLEDLAKKSPESLGSSDKAKLKILSSIIYNPKVLILDNILTELDYNDKNRIIELLNEYVKKGNIILNMTNDVEETVYGDRIIITNDNILVADGKTKLILNEEKLLKKLGLGLPFITELNKYLLDYGIIKKEKSNMKDLVNEIWK